jgi:epoxyqueuosine reductase
LSCDHGAVPRAAVSEPPTPDGPLEGADPSVALSADLTDAVVAIGRGSGLHSVGVTTADVFDETRRHLFERRRLGLHADMQFTYRNPERSTDPTRILPGARSLVVGAYSYRHSEPAQLEPGKAVDSKVDQGSSRPQGRVARYARADHYAALRRALAPIAAHLREQGWRATVVCDDNALVDRAAAHRAGLGWFGKNSLLILPGAGSWFVLGSVVTDAPLMPTPPEADAPVAHAEGCGSCSRCLTACPTGALVAPGVVDARRCLAWLVQAPGSFPDEFRVALGDRIYGCDECQQVCPINKVADRRDPPPPPPARPLAPPRSRARSASSEDRSADGPLVDLLELLEAADEDLLAAHGRWYIAERDPRYLRRNALVALGNVGDGGHAGTEQALRHWLRAGDPLLAEHARWAAVRLGRADLVAPSP